MNRNAIFIIIIVIILLGLGLCADSCQKNPKQKKVGEYSLKLIANPSFYGIDVKHVMNSQYKDLEKMFNLKAQIDDERAVVVLKREKDFISKKFKTKYKDILYIFHGPMAEAQYKGYKNIKPTTILLDGSLDPREDVKNKEKIITELKKNILANKISHSAIEKIKKYFVLGDYEEDMSLIINFDNTEFRVAKFVIFFTGDYICYQYIFSKTSQPYPY